MYNDDSSRYPDLRITALRQTIGSLGLDQVDFGFEKPYAAMMEFVMPAGTATLFCAATGDASLYTTRSFGILGGVAHHDVRAAARRFVKASEDCLIDMEEVFEFPGPRLGWNRFFTLTAGKVLTAEASEESSASNFRLMQDAGDAVLTELRKVAMRNK